MPQRQAIGDLRGERLDRERADAGTENNPKRLADLSADPIASSRAAVDLLGHQHSVPAMVAGEWPRTEREERSAHTERRERPRERRRASTFRPDFVRIRERNPCFRERFAFFGR